jgi:RNA polymerase sigma-70 factor, ECF subfamily
MSSFGATFDFGLFAKQAALLRSLLNEVLATSVRGGEDRASATARIRTRAHNDVSTRHLPPGTKHIGGHGRPSIPAHTGPATDNFDSAISEEITTVLPIIDELVIGTGGSTGYPDRPDPSDAAHEVWTLVERAQQGDTEAFGLIYDRYVDTVFRFIYFRVGNRPLAEDLTSDTFLRALKRINSFTWQGRDLGAWLVTIARNLVADHFKSGRYRLEVTTGDVLDADREDRGPEGSPEAAVVDHITNVALLTAVKQLNPEQQECIVLRFLQGFSVAETAQAMGKNEGAIKALQYRAVRALARLLPEGFQP